MRKLSLLLVAVAAALIVVVAAPARPAKTAVAVTASEFKFVLTRKAVPSGVVFFTLTNKGKLPHDFKIAGKKTAVIGPGKTARLSVTFRKAGKFAYVCTVPGHASAGMKGTLTVK